MAKNHDDVQKLLDLLGAQPHLIDSAVRPQQPGDLQDYFWRVTRAVLSAKCALLIDKAATPHRALSLLATKLEELGFEAWGIDNKSDDWLNFEVAGHGLPHRGRYRLSRQTAARPADLVRDAMPCLEGQLVALELTVYTDTDTDALILVDAETAEKIRAALDQDNMGLFAWPEKLEQPQLLEKL